MEDEPDLPALFEKRYEIKLKKKKQLMKGEDFP